MNDKRHTKDGLINRGITWLSDFFESSSKIVVVIGIIILVLFIFFWKLSNFSNKVANVSNNVKNMQSEQESVKKEIFLEDGKSRFENMEVHLIGLEKRMPKEGKTIKEVISEDLKVYEKQLSLSINQFMKETEESIEKISFQVTNLNIKVDQLSESDNLQNTEIERLKTNIAELVEQKNQILENMKIEVANMLEKINEAQAILDQAISSYLAKEEKISEIALSFEDRINGLNKDVSLIKQRLSDVDNLDSRISVIESFDFEGIISRIVELESYKSFFADQAQQEEYLQNLGIVKTFLKNFNDMKDRVLEIELQVKQKQEEVDSVENTQDDNPLLNDVETSLTPPSNENNTPDIPIEEIQTPK